MNDATIFDAALEARIAAYQAKREARIDRLRARAHTAQHESQAIFKSWDQQSSMIPMGQPILVGHYSEGRDRRFRARLGRMLERTYERQQAAAHLEARVQAAEGNDAIFSDDPQAGEKLEAKIARLQVRQEAMKRINAMCRKLKLKKSMPDLADRLHRAIAEQHLSEADVKAVIEASRHNWKEDLAFPSYALTNNNGNIRRLKERWAVVTTQQAKESSEIEVNGIKIVENVEANRLQLFFPGKPNESIRKELKAAGFRWAPSEGAWQRHCSSSATYWAKVIAEKQQG